MQAGLCGAVRWWDAADCRHWTLCSCSECSAVQCVQQRAACSASAAWPPHTTLTALHTLTADRGVSLSGNYITLYSSPVLNFETFSHPARLHSVWPTPGPVSSVWVQVPAVPSCPPIGWLTAAGRTDQRAATWLVRPVVTGGGAGPLTTALTIVQPMVAPQPGTHSGCPAFILSTKSTKCILLQVTFTFEIVNLLLNV